MVSNGTFIGNFGPLVLDVGYLHENGELPPQPKASAGLELAR